MPVLKRDELDFGDKGKAFVQGVIDECGLNEYEGDIIGYQLRVRLNDMHFGKHVYHLIRFGDDARYNEFDAPKLMEIFGFTGGIDYFVDKDAEHFFMGKAVGVTIKPNPQKPDKYYTSLFRPRERKVASEEAKARFRASRGQAAQPVAQQVEEGPDSDLPF